MVPEVMTCEMSSLEMSIDDCCANESGEKKSENDCEKICACCVNVLGVIETTSFWNYLFSEEYLMHNTHYSEGESQLCIIGIDQPPRGVFNLG